jgi:hypothetical protein
MRARSVGWKVACLAVWVSGCGLGTSVVGGSVDAGVDVGPDVASDLGAMDTPAVDAPFMCRNNSECVGNAGGPVCASGRCAACSATDDRCPAGQRCDTTTFACVPGCRNDDACAGATVDGGAGVTAPRCDPTTRACVACVVDDHCTLGQRCMGNQCVPGCDAARGCMAGQTCCDGGCVDIRTNTGNCGGCGMTCAVNNATPACLVGACSVGSCAPGFGDCDSAPANGCEIDTRVTLTHCGACNNACPARANATPTCAAGACGFLCDAGFDDCDGDASNGCEADTRVSTAHCGACGTVCATRANAATTCVAGACGFACDAGFRDCDGDASNGCEVDIRTSTTHCGSCGMACAMLASGAPVCSAGACGVACELGFGNCDGVLANGCEVDTRVTVTHCGMCGTVCPARAGATSTCAAGACGFACNAGFADCDMNPANGCEVDTRTSTAHCGVCGNRCSFASAAPTCAAGVCGLGACASGFGNCNSTPGDGCEVDITTSTTHCGACGAACVLANATASCVARACAVASCATNFGNCDGSAANGCEAPLLTDAQNCGACGNRCASGVCVAGLCNPFPSTGGEGAFAPSTDIALSPGIHNFTTVSIPVGVRITTTGTGVLDLRATGAVVINGIIDVSGSTGGEQAAALGRGVSCVDNGNGSQGGFTGNVLFASTGGDVVTGIGQFGALGGGGTGSPGTDGDSRLGVTYAGRGSTGGGSGGGWRCTGGGGGGGGGFAGGGGGFGYQSNECGCLGTGGAGGTGGGAGGGAAGASVGQGGRGGGSGGDAVYNGAVGLTRTPAAASDCAHQTAIGGGGGGGSIGAEAVADLAMATTFRPGSAGGGGGGDEGAGGGGGGGALRVASPVSITVGASGRLAAQGGRGGRQSCGGGPGGGGSGGAIYLATPALTVATGATVTAAAGDGGGNISVVTQAAGTGGLGRIRISGGVGASGCTLAGTLSPALASGCNVTATPTAGRAFVARYPQ